MIRKRMISAVLTAIVGATLLLAGAAPWGLPGGDAIIQTTGR